MPRPKGSPNRSKIGLLARLKREFPGYHPVVEMARTAMDDSLDAQVRFSAHREVAKYVTPQLKSVEMTVDANVNIGLREITDEEWKALSFLEHGDAGPGSSESGS